MSILADSNIKELCIRPNPQSDSKKENWVSMIEPFEAQQIRTQRRAPTKDELNLWNQAVTGVTNYPDSFICDNVDIGLQIKEKILSYGLSSAGYDVRLSNEFAIFNNINHSIIDPLGFDNNCLYHHKGDYCIIPPNSYVLGSTIEYFNIPKDIMVVCVGKSTYARCGAIINVTPIEPGFSGNIVIEISNATALPLKIYANQGIAQFIFFKMERHCDVSYAEGKRKYQGQTGLQLALG